MFDHNPIMQDNQIPNLDLHLDLDTYNLHRTAARNNMIYDPAHFMREVFQHLKMKESNPRFTSPSPWIDVFLDSTNLSTDDDNGHNFNSQYVKNQYINSQYIEQYAQLEYDPYSELSANNTKPDHDVSKNNINNVNNADDYMEALLGLTLNESDLVDKISPDQDAVYHNDNEIRLNPDVRDKLNRMNIQIKPNVCVICRRNTDNVIRNSCASDCAYYCHDVCAGRWIGGRLDNPHPYCMMCGETHELHHIPNVVTDNGFIFAVRSMIQENLMNLANLGNQFMTYIDFRGITLQDLTPHNENNENNWVNRVVRSGRYRG